MENNEEFGYLMPKKTTIVDFSNTLTKEARGRFIQELLITSKELSDRCEQVNKLDNKNLKSNQLDSQYSEDCKKFFENLFNESQKENNDNKL